MDLRFVLGFPDPARAVDRAAAARLWAHRLLFLALYTLRLPALVVERVLRAPEKRAHHYALLAAAGPAYLASSWLDALLERRAEVEWRRRHLEPAGSEMYLHFATG